MPRSYENSRKRRYYSKERHTKTHKKYISRSRSRSNSYKTRHRKDDQKKNYYKHINSSESNSYYSSSNNSSDDISDRSRSYSRKKYDRYRDYKRTTKYSNQRKKYHNYHDYNNQKTKKKHYYENYSSQKDNKNSHDQESDDEKNGKDAGHYKYKVGQTIKNYKIIQHLGDGTFGRCLEVKDIDTNKVYAMKVIRAVERYIDSAKTEASILEYIQKNDPEDKNGLVRMQRAFEYGENYFMVFEKLGMSLYDFLKKNNYRGFPIDYIQSFAKQILTSIGFLHQTGLTHTDLKPENILLVNDECVPIRYAIGKGEESPINRSSTCSKSEEKTYYKPVYKKIKIIDFGGATYDHEHHSSIINTRQYRAPEVILGCCEWNHKSDIWSIACILLELYSGDLFFETHESYEHLALIERAIDDIPYWMANNCQNELKKHFHCDKDYFEKNRTYFDWPKYASNEESIAHVKNMRLITDIIPEEYKEFIDLLRTMLVIDPNKRIEANQALQHEFFRIDYTKILREYENHKQMNDINSLYINIYESFE